MIFSTTTAIDVDEEFLNRCLVLTVDEGREQTRAIHRMQREMHTEEGIWLRKDRKTLRRLHQNAQRLLRPVEVINPWARELTFVDDKTRTRRDHEKYLALIDAIALLRQHQRATKVSVRGGESEPALTATLEDVELANRLANEVLGRSLDELPPQTRRLLELTHRMVGEACDKLQMKPAEYRFTRRELREYTGWRDTQLRVHLGRLVELEYALAHRGSQGQRFVYELLYDGEGRDGKPFLMGLLDVEKLRAESMATTETSRASAPTSRSGSGPDAGRSRGGCGLAVSLYDPAPTPLLAHSVGNNAEKRI